MATPWDDQSAQALTLALARGDHDAVARSCDRLVALARRGEPLTAGQVLQALRALQEYRRIEHLQDVAEAALLRGLADTEVTHRYALALLDAGRVSAAQALLMALPADIQAGNADVRGALARVHKERLLAFEAGPDAAAELATAIGLYRRSYEEYDADLDEWTYHGVNAAALLVRAARDGIAIPGIADPGATARDIAMRILGAVSNADATAAPWLAASAAEAALCIGDYRRAGDFLRRYLAHPGTRAFAVNSTLRQFQRLWQLDRVADPVGTALVALLQAELVLKSGRIEIPVAALADETNGPAARMDDVLERIRDENSMRPIRWLRRGLAVSRSVARLGDDLRSLGTGFVVASSYFDSPAGWPALVLVTARHVLDAAGDIDELRAEFFEIPAVVNFTAADLLWRGVVEVDAAILGLPAGLGQPDNQLAALPVRERIDPYAYAVQDKKTYVIGHPEGQSEVVVSVTGSTLSIPQDASGEDIARYAWYQTSTLGGSSGSPVFDENWKTIAIHRGYRPGPDGGNHGVRLDYLRDYLRASRAAPLED